MSLRNLHWFSQNEKRNYPLDDLVTGLSDTGQRLPNEILVDLRLSFPDSLAQYAFVSAVTVTRNLVTVIVQGSHDPETTTEFIPLAYVTIKKPIIEGKVYSFVSENPDVGGWLVFGSGIQSIFSGTFSQPQQTRLAVKATNPYKSLAIPSVKGPRTEKQLTGVVNLVAEPPLFIVKDKIEINNILRDAIIFRLEEQAETSENKTESVFKKFAGPCGANPESNTCGDPQPIEFIESVSPDCDGEITLEFTGCNRVFKVDEHSFAVDCYVQIDDACLPDYLPDDFGKLPSQKPPLSLSFPYDLIPEEPVSESYSVASLPYIECFTDGLADNFETKVGKWDLVVDGSDEWKICPHNSVSGSVSYSNAYSYAAKSRSSRNVTVWEGNDFSCVRRLFETNLRILDNGFGQKHNAGLVFNYRPSLTNPSQNVYHIAEIDYDTQQFRLSYFNGISFQTLISFTKIGIALNRWYRIRVIVLPYDRTKVQITVNFKDQIDLSTDITFGPFIRSGYYPSHGTVGFGTNRSWAYFSYLKIEERLS